MTYTAEEVGEQVVVAARSVEASDPGRLAAAMQILLRDDNWKTYVDPADRRKHEWQDFRQFVETRLRTSVDALVKALQNSPRIAAQVAKLATAEPHAGVKVDSTFTRPQPRTRVGGLIELRRRGRNDLADRVEAGEIKVSAARVEAGFAKPRVTVRVDSPEAAIGALLQRFTRDELRSALGCR